MQKRPKILNPDAADALAMAMVGLKKTMPRWAVLLKKLIWFFWRPYRVEISNLVETTVKPDEALLQWRIRVGPRVVKTGVYKMNGFDYRCFGMLASLNMFYKTRDAAQAWAFENIRIFANHTHPYL